MGKTLDLARKLGLVQKREIPNSNWIKVKSPSESNQKFSHFMVIDFESTCWEGRSGPAQEIIEYLFFIFCRFFNLLHFIILAAYFFRFPAVILDVQTGAICREVFHHYVQPIEEPNLSNFCTKFTGITQEQVDQGAPLGTTLMMFRNWQKTHYPNFVYGAHGDKNCAIVTWTDWDLQLQLENECKRKNLVYPPCLRSWIDLKYVYQKFYGRKPKGLNGALQEMGLAFEGREHSGLCDSKNTALLLNAMIKDGCILGLTKCKSDMKIDPSLSYHDHVSST